MNASGTTRAKLYADFRGLGIRPGGALLVHASLRSLGPVEGGGETVILSLLDCLGPEGTLLMPALSYATVGPGNPRFSQASTPSCVGALTEWFRTRPGTRRSLHPTHSVCAVGAEAGSFLQGHESDTTPCGPNSPFRRLRDRRGQILMLGCGLRPNTSMHGVEELTAPPYLFAGVTRYELERENGEVCHAEIRNHGFAGWEQRYDRVMEVLEPDALRSGRVAEAHCWLIEAGELWQAADRQLRREPLFFVDRIGGQPPVVGPIPPGEAGSP